MQRAEAADAAAAATTDPSLTPKPVFANAGVQTVAPVRVCCVYVNVTCDRAQLYLSSPCFYVCVCVCVCLSLSLSLSLFLSLCLSARSPAAGPGRGSRGASTQNCRVGVEVGHRTKRRHCRCSRSRSRHRCIERSCVVCSFRRRADGSRRCRCRYGVRLFCLPRSALNCVTSRRVFPRCAVAEADARNAAAVERAKSQAKIMEEQLQFATTRADDSAEDAREAHTQLTAATTQIKTLQVRRCRLVWET